MCVCACFGSLQKGDASQDMWRLCVRGDATSLVVLPHYRKQHATDVHHCFLCHTACAPLSITFHITWPYGVCGACAKQYIVGPRPLVFKCTQKVHRCGDHFVFRPTLSPPSLPHTPLPVKKKKIERRRL